MKRWHRNGIVFLFVGCWLGLAGRASAGPYVNVMQPCDCPPNHYSSLHIMAPALYRWAAWCQGPCRYTFARVLHPEVATTTYIKKYHCPSVNPLQFALENYPGMAGTPPASSYQSTSPLAQKQQAAPPQELPGTPPEKGPAPEKLPAPREEPDKK
jgi:hypothetical protein